MFSTCSQHFLKNYQQNPKMFPKFSQFVPKMSQVFPKFVQLFENKSICFPKGLFNDRVVQLAKEIGYDFQYCSIPGSYTNKNIPNVYNRNLVQFSNVNELSLILKGGLSFFKIWFRNKHYKR